MKKPLVYLGMSGGVDSSVSAIVLLEAGYRVHGVHLRLWSPLHKVKEAEQTIERFEQVCAKLGLTHEVLDYREQFQEDVISQYLRELKSGLTPNPCVHCNRKIKWGALLEYARSNGAEYLASGHYSILKRDAHGVVELYKGKDAKKDQSYFLSALPQSTFQSMLFPLGEYHKTQVRAIAVEAGLPDFSKLDSQDLCFLEAGGQEEFLKRYASESLVPGPICTSDGKLIGEHMGLPLYTIGQRKGIRVAAPEPYYVLEKDVATNTLVVDISANLNRDVIRATDLSWVSGEAPDFTKPNQMKIRSAAQPVLGRFSTIGNSDIIVKLDKSLRDITAGQRLVIYDGDLCLGSAEIVSAADSQEFEVIK
ncbi:MAG: tRNA 2-thiouridine(34) synthase MnmA [Anaerolineaceae bacterium]